MLKRIKYLSRQSYAMTRSDVDEIVASSRVRNAKLGITGALVATGNVFFRIIEGPAEAIDRLFATIKADTRHTDVVCLAVQIDREERLFPNWGMLRLSLENSAQASAVEEMLRQLARSDPSESTRLSDQLSRVMAAELRAA